MKRRICGTVASVACLAIPAGAAAHPSVYTVTAKVAPAGVTNPTEGQLTDQLRYSMNNDGWAYALRETNGKTTMAPSTTRCCQALSAVADQGAVAGAEVRHRAAAACDVRRRRSAVQADDPLMAERSLLGLRAVAEDVREPGRRPGEVDPRRQDGHGGRPVDRLRLRGGMRSDWRHLREGRRGPDLGRLAVRDTSRASSTRSRLRSPSSRPPWPRRRPTPRPPTRPLAQKSHG